jgi:hypothetical protein
MNINVTFRITVHTRTRGNFHMDVVHFYSSDQVERFKIKGKNDRYVILEKRLDVKRQPWKLVEGTFNPQNIQEAAQALVDMQDAIDRYLAQKGDQTDGHILPKH